MITLILLASAGLAFAAFSAVRHAQIHAVDGYENEHGFHPGPQTYAQEEPANEALHMGSNRAA